MKAATSETAERTLTSDAQLLQDYLQSAGILVSTADDGAGKIAAFQNPEGQAEAIVIGPRGNLFHACREPMGDSGWNMYGPMNMCQVIGIFYDPDMGRLRWLPRCLFARACDPLTKAVIA